MILTNRIQKAINLASHLHRDQVRHDKNQTPYFSHLISVAIILSNYTQDEDTLIAGIMHDCLEDVPDYTFENLQNELGEKVARLVTEVTENKALPYKERKQEYLNNLKSHQDDAIMISMADKMHNIQSIINGINTEESKSWKIMGQNPEEQLVFWKNIHSIAIERNVNPELTANFKNTIENIKTLYTQNGLLIL